MTTKYTVKGVNSDRDFCECCGKTGLSRVVWIENQETGEIRHFGVVCAAAPQKGFAVEKEIKCAIKKFEGIQRGIILKASAAYRAAGGKLRAINGNYLNGMERLNVALWEKCKKEAA